MVDPDAARVIAGVHHNQPFRDRPMREFPRGVVSRNQLTRRSIALNLTVAADTDTAALNLPAAFRVRRLHGSSRQPLSHRERPMATAAQPSTRRPRARHLTPCPTLLSQIVYCYVNLTVQYLPLCLRSQERRRPVDAATGWDDLSTALGNQARCEIPVMASIVSALASPGDRSPRTSFEMNVSSQPKSSAASRDFRSEFGKRRSSQSLNCSCPGFITA